MARLSRAQERARRQINDAVDSALAPEPLAARLAAALAVAVPFDGYRLFSVDPGSLLINRLLAASDNDGWARREWLRDVYLRAEELPYIELPNLMAAGLGPVAFQERQDLSWGYAPDVLAGVAPAEHRRLFHDLRSPVGGTILAGFAAHGRWVAAIQAYRRDAALPFRAGEIAFLRLVAPAIGRGLAAALARERAVGGAPTASGIIVLGPDATPRLRTPAAEEWEGRLRDAGRSAHGPVSTAVWAALARLRSGGASAAAGVVIAPSTAGPVRVEASPAGADGSVAIVLAPAAPPVQPRAPADWPLTDGERRVVDLALRGSTNAEIADSLFVSVNTVEWHLRGAYEKLGVRSRTGLLARLFQDVAPPNLRGAGAAGPG